MKLALVIDNGGAVAVAQVWALNADGTHASLLAQVGATPSQDEYKSFGFSLSGSRELVDEQAQDEGLWCQPANIVEDYLQRALRELHARVELETTTVGEDS